MKGFVIFYYNILIFLEDSNLWLCVIIFIGICERSEERKQLYNLLNKRMDTFFQRDQLWAEL